MYDAIGQLHVIARPPRAQEDSTPNATLKRRRHETAADARRTEPTTNQALTKKRNSRGRDRSPMRYYAAKRRPCPFPDAPCCRGATPTARGNRQRGPFFSGVREWIKGMSAWASKSTDSRVLAGRFARMAYAVRYLNTARLRRELPTFRPNFDWVYQHEARNETKPPLRPKRAQTNA